jgi:aspartate ammonia-lyase
MSHRREKDSLGEIEVPADAYWGAQTQRALRNFPISGLGPDPAFVRAYVYQKQAAARVNGGLGLIEAKKADAVAKAADEILSGKLMDQFVVDPFQAGAGTSHHMNTNEVLANRSNEILGGKKGDYDPVHPNNDVNFGQSTNDTFPTAMRISVHLSLGRLEKNLDDLVGSLEKKAEEFADIVTAGRTHLQDATPITLGQAFQGYADAIARARRDMSTSAQGLLELGIGGTAVGTGMNRHPDYPRLACEELSRITGIPVVPTRIPVAMHQSTHDFARFAAGLKGTALETNKLANDLRLMASGPTSGLAEIALPPVQPGSSIMPGKVNPVMAENMNMVCFGVLGAESSIAHASQAGQFQLNVMMPVIIHEILFAMKIFTNALGVFREYCVAGITANEERAREYAERTVALATVLNPIVGYERAAKIVKRAVEDKRSIIAVTAEELGISEGKARKLLDPIRWTQPGVIDEDEIRSRGPAK